MKRNATKGLGLAMVAVLAMSAAAFAKPAMKKEVTGQVNLNTATLQQLDLLPGIGQKAAKRIIEHRAKTPFTSVDDLKKVKGFGQKKLEKLKPFLTVTGQTTVAVRKVPSKSDEPGPKPASAQGRRAAGKR